MGGIIAGYYRCSTEEQSRKGLSVPFQRERLCSEAKRLNLGKIKHYDDSGFSAKDTNRPAFQSLKKDIEEGLIDTIIVYKLDRLSRSILDLASFFKLLEKKEVKFISVTEQFDTSTPQGKAMINISGVLAELERDMVVARVKDVMWNKASKGMFCGGQPPYGYDVVDKELVINKEEAKVLKTIYEKFEEIKTLRGLTHWLNERGYKTKRGTTFASTTVKRLLTNPVSKGYFTYGKRANNSSKYHSKDKWLVVKGKFKPIISEKQFDRVQKIFASKGFIPHAKPGRVYPLTGLIRCACGGAMTGYTYRKESGKEYGYYKCHMHQSKGKSVCPGNTLNKDDIENFIYSEIAERVKLKFTEEEKRKIQNHQSLDDSATQLKSIEKLLKKHSLEEEKILELHLENEIDKSLLKKKLDEVKKKKEKLLKKKAEIEVHISPESSKRRDRLLKKIDTGNINILDLPDEVKRECLRQIVKRITVTWDKEVELELYEL